MNMDDFEFPGTARNTTKANLGKRKRDQDEVNAHVVTRSTSSMYAAFRPSHRTEPTKANTTRLPGKFLGCFRAKVRIDGDGWYHYVHWDETYDGDPVRTIGVALVCGGEVVITNRSWLMKHPNNPDFWGLGVALKACLYDKKKCAGEFKSLVDAVQYYCSHHVRIPPMPEGRRQRDTLRDTLVKKWHTHSGKETVVPLRIMAFIHAVVEIKQLWVEAAVAEQRPVEEWEPAIIAVIKHTERSKQ